MNLVDSSGWLEIFTQGNNSSKFLKPLESMELVIVPTICIFEVFRVILKKRGESEAIRCALEMQQGQVVPLDEESAVDAAKISIDLNLAMADSIIYTVARKHEAVLWTQDEHFQNLPGVKFIPKS